MTIPPQFLDELRTRIGLVDVISRQVRLVRRGREHVGLCPFHKEKTPSFTVNVDKGFYHCFGCGAHGNVIDFVMGVHGLAFPEAVERLAAEAGLEVPSDTPEAQARERERRTLHAVLEAAAAHFAKVLRLPEGREALAYLRGRGLDDATIAAFGLGYAPEARGALKAALARDGIGEDQLIAAGLMRRPEDDRPAFDYFRRRVMFPIADRRGRVIAFGGRVLGAGEPKYLNSPEGPLFAKGRVLYGWAQALVAARQGVDVVVTEGYMDVIALRQAGFAAAVAPLGTALTEDQMRELWRLVPAPILCFDGDAAGQRAAARAAERAVALLRPGHTLRFAAMPPGEDPDSLIRTQGRDAMARVVAQAVPLSEALWRSEGGDRLRAAGPEARAGLEDRLMAHVRRIGDPTVRNHFRQAFQDRLRPPRMAGVASPGLGRGRVGGMAVAVQEASKTHVDTLARAQRTLLAILINHPAFFEAIEEEIGAVAFADPELDRLRQELVALLHGGGAPESEPAGPAPTRSGAVREALRARGLGSVLDALLRDPLVQSHRTLKASAPPEDVEAAWRENFDVLVAAKVRSETVATRPAGGEGYSVEDWERHRTLLEASLPGRRE